MRFFRLLSVVAAWLCGVATAFAGTNQAPEILVESLTDQSEVIFNPKRDVAWATNGVMIRYTNAVLTAQQAMVNFESGEARAEGEVSLRREGLTWRGDKLVYNFKTREMEAGRFRTGMIPFFAVGESVQASTTNRAVVLNRAMVTTDDVEDPAYEIRAKSIKVIDGNRIEARDATLFIGNTPVMYFPKFSRSLDRHPNNWVFTPGYRSLYGAYLLTTYNWVWNTNLTGAVNMDFRSKRGVGVGPDFNWDLGRAGKGKFQYYYTLDDEPGTDPSGKPIDDDRQRVRFSHFVSITTNLTARAVVNGQSDAQIIRDFFETEYRKNPQPKSFLEVNQLWPNFSLDLLAQPQINDFFTTVERLPDLRLTGARQQLGVSPVFYEGETSAGYFRYSPAEGSGTNAYAAMRADTFHQLLLPQNYFGWLNFTPRVGVRGTHYGESEGRGTTLDDTDRGVFNTGAELSARASQTWAGVRNKTLDVTGIRHIIEPSFNYVYVPTPSKSPRELPQFDTELPSLRLLPVDFPDYNAIDSIDTQNAVRLGLRNKVQTKRGEEIQNLVNWALVTDWRIDPREDQGTFSDLYSELDLQPRSWLGFSSEIRWNIEDDNLRYSNHGLTITPNNTWSWALGHFYFREDPAYGTDSENNLFRSSLYFRVDQNWGLRATHYFEARDGTMEEQSYSIYRDLRSWTTALTFRIRDNRIGPDDFTIAITFSLKAFPRFGLGKDRDYHSLLLGS